MSGDTGANTSDTRPGRPIGFGAYTQLAHDRIAEYFAAQQREALVVGVFGEWGSGKSTLLADIAATYENDPKNDNASEVILRVDFNAWRFEREEHLLIPLLFTVETTLNDYLKKVEQALATTDGAVPRPRRWWQRAGTLPPGQTRVAWLRERAALLGTCVLALTRAVKFTVGVPDVAEAEIDPYAAIEAVQEQRDRAAERARRSAKPVRPDWQSLYYDLHRELKKSHAVIRHHRDRS